MIKIKHNILHNKFEKILVNPKDKNVPYNFFKKQEEDEEDGDEIVTRTLELSDFDKSKQITLIVSKIITEAGTKFIRYYNFRISEIIGSKDEFKNENIYIAISDGEVVCTASETINLSEAESVIIKEGFDEAKTLNYAEPNLNSNELYKCILKKYHETKYDAMSSDDRYSNFINSVYELQVLQLFVSGIKNYIEESKLGILDNTQRLLDEIQIQIDKYNISQGETYLNNCKLILKLADERMLENAFVLWDKKEEFDILWDTAHFDCRFSVGLNDYRWHLWVGTNNHSSDDESYTNGVGGTDFDGNCFCAQDIFEDFFR